MACTSTFSVECQDLISVDVIVNGSLTVIVDEQDRDEKVLEIKLDTPSDGVFPLLSCDSKKPLSCHILGTDSLVLLQQSVPEDTDPHISNQSHLIKQLSSLPCKAFILKFSSEKDREAFLALLTGFNALINSGDDYSVIEDKSVFDQRTESTSAKQYFQFYALLSQQQNMLQDFIRTHTYQRAIHLNYIDFKDKVVLDVGAGSGILSYFAIQAGARKVYAVEASNMAAYCEQLVEANGLNERIIVVNGKIEEIQLPECVDVIISEPMGYMLFNERMLESYIHARKFLRDPFQRDPLACNKLNQSVSSSLAKMFPSIANLYIAPFTDEALFVEIQNKASFWYQTSFYGVNMSSLHESALFENLSQPIVDTFDISICMAKAHCYPVDFRTSRESDLHDIRIPLRFTMLYSGMVHGIAFWFDVGFVGEKRTVWLSTAPTEPLTHWYQVRCLFTAPLFAQEGDRLEGLCHMKCNEKQSYDVYIELGIPGTRTKVCNKLDLKNPCFRYTGVTTSNDSSHAQNGNQSNMEVPTNQPANYAVVPESNPASSSITSSNVFSFQSSVTPISTNSAIIGKPQSTTVSVSSLFASVSGQGDGPVITPTMDNMPILSPTHLIHGMGSSPLIFPPVSSPNPFSY